MRYEQMYFVLAFRILLFKCSIRFLFFALYMHVIINVLGGGGGTIYMPTCTEGSDMPTTRPQIGYPV